MRRVLFQWRGIQIYAYPAMLYLGLVLGIVAGTFAAARLGLDSAKVYVTLLLLVPVALVGARLLFVASHWGLFRREPSRIWRRSDGGAALYGGLVLAFLLSLPLLKALKLSIGAFWDAATVTILTGIVFGRMGCLLHGCCAGRPTESRYALRLPNVQGVWRRRIPAQILEAGLAAALLLGSMAAWNRLPGKGALFLGALAAYAAGRWWLESTKETIDRIGSLSLHRAISAALVVFSTGGLVLMLLHQA
ncbi:MAG TPA: prolipoprotein diacylglyceryl transferase family protein [Terriglobia bacterium]|nr:prolipoprotein diacylglyceryl transferase family protein [Terriglobia bacterium]